MSRKWYPLALDKLLTAGIDITDGTATMVAVDSTYTFNVAHEFADDLTGELGTPVVLSVSGVSGGEVSATSPDYTGIGIGDVVKAFVVYMDTTMMSGSPATSPLVLFLDTKADTSPVSITGDGADLPVSFQNGTLAKLQSSA